MCSSVEGFGLEAEARMTTWHVMMPAENGPDNRHSQEVSEGRQLLLKTVNRVSLTPVLSPRSPAAAEDSKLCVPNSCPVSKVASCC
ncbi:WD repeat and FYVE domain-containing protein 3-like [Oncorhynchus kisutch]|uniref:WD repeat and FYVE domain-containing protein 3-like n=1 Tax=Oncorhynchus kisutch TaxID=8019 RepID=UPI0012DD1DE4|nr:WD repeat and FYVE domain-containing protein 3-like [Oncorhynchus kisutch]